MRRKDVPLTLAEIAIVFIIFFIQILPHWSVKNATAGDFFCLEITAMLILNIYENIKNKV